MESWIPLIGSQVYLRSMKKIFSLSFPALLLTLAGCGRDVPTSPVLPPAAEKPAERAAAVLKLKVAAGGEIAADGKPVTLEQLADRLAELKRAGGGVWYYRENPEGEPHPNAMKVIELIARHRLPVRLFTKPDFSNAGE